jgi:hypothetical protein
LGLVAAGTHHMAEVSLAAACIRLECMRCELVAVARPVALAMTMGSLEHMLNWSGERQEGWLAHRATRSVALLLVEVVVLQKLQHNLALHAGRVEQQQVVLVLRQLVVRPF